MPVLLAVLDANVLYPAHLRDVLLRLALDGHFRPKWTDRIHDEWTRSLLAKRPDLTAAQLAYTREQMETAFPDATVTDYAGHESRLALPDPDDRHVVAAAVEAGAGVVVTFNLKDFPATVLGRLGVEAVHPDAFVLRLMERDPDGVVETMREHRASLRRPQIGATEYVAFMIRAGLADVGTAVQHRIRDL